MNRVELTVLGSGSAIPIPRRRHPSLLVRDWNGNTMLLDSGEDVQTRLREVGVSPSSISYVVITHPHGDHINGLAGLLMTMSLQGRKRPLTLVSTSEAVEFAMETLEATKANLGFEVRAIIASGYGSMEVSRTSSTILTLSWAPACHTVEALLVRLDWVLRPRISLERIKKLGLQPGPWVRIVIERGVAEVGGVRVSLADIANGVGSRFSIGYTGDSAPCASVEEHLKGVDILVHDSTLESSMREEAYSRGHSTAEDAARVALRVGARLLVLFHPSSRYQGFEARKLYHEARRMFSNTVLAWDGLKIVADVRKTGGAAGI